MDLAPGAMLTGRLAAGSHAWNLTRRALVMGILNRTRDSFYDGGRHFGLDALLARAEVLVRDGADILDVGARPGGVGVADVGAVEEEDLAGETVAALRARFDVPVSVDTWRGSVAAVAFTEGAVIATASATPAAEARRACQRLVRALRPPTTRSAPSAAAAATTTRAATGGTCPLRH